jgi:uncharacterized membrane protein
MNTASKRQKVGLVLAGIYSALNILGVLFLTPDGQVGPPIGILIIDSVLGLLGLVAVIVTWRTGNRAALRVAAGAIIIITLTALPAFFVDVPAGIKLLVGVWVLLTIAAVVLMFSPGRRSTPVLD